jgi:hypothetical protein
MSVRSQAGAMKLTTLVFLLVLGSAIFVGVKTIPAMVAHFEFQDDVNQVATRAVYSDITADAIRDSIYGQAQDLGIPITKKEILVQRAQGVCTIVADYDVPINIPIKPFSLHFTTSAGDRNILMHQHM